MTARSQIIYRLKEGEKIFEPPIKRISLIRNSLIYLLHLYDDDRDFR